jgi:hypothetical protein
MVIEDKGGKTEGVVKDESDESPVISIAEKLIIQG